MLEGLYYPNVYWVGLERVPMIESSQVLFSRSNESTNLELCFVFGRGEKSISVDDEWQQIEVVDDARLVCFSRGDEDGRLHVAETQMLGFREQ